MDPDKQKLLLPELISEIERYKDRFRKIKDVVEYQSNLRGLWPLIPATLSEHLLASALRHLHAVIEGDEIISNMHKEDYWDLEK